MIRIVTVILLVAAFVRIHEATRDIRFHSDEALYSAYARNAAVHGKWALDGPLDKPPLSIYASALGMHFFGSEITPDNVIDVPIIRGEFAAKLPNIFAGLITVALVFALGRTLYRHDHNVALISMLIAAVSPYMIAYSASAFTDALMLLFMMAGVVMAARGRPAISGAFFALSVGAKPQGILYIPLAIGFLWLTEIQAKRFFGQFWRDIGKLCLALAGGVVILLAWDMMRPETSVFTLGAMNVSQGRLFAPMDDWVTRHGEWHEYGGDLLGLAWFTAGAIEQFDHRHPGRVGLRRGRPGLRAQHRAAEVRVDAARVDHAAYAEGVVDRHDPAF
jgi:4-amino-4-deoxy-L-arabinose transferase-like glycosyltransferase